MVSGRDEDCTGGALDVLGEEDPGVGVGAGEDNRGAVAACCGDFLWGTIGRYDDVGGDGHITGFAGELGGVRDCLRVVPCVWSGDGVDAGQGVGLPVLYATTPFFRSWSSSFARK